MSLMNGGMQKRNAKILVTVLIGLIVVSFMATIIVPFWAG